jgi:hypothetical protein
MLALSFLPGKLGIGRILPVLVLLAGCSVGNAQPSNPGNTSPSTPSSTPSSPSMAQPPILMDSIFRLLAYIVRQG